LEDNPIHKLFTKHNKDAEEDRLLDKLITRFETINNHLTKRSNGLVGTENDVATEDNE